MESIHSIHHRVLRLFTWAPDKETFGTPEHWQSFADDVETGKAFHGDCDNFALTCAELCHRAGYAPEDIQLGLCRTETGEMHLVAIVGPDCLDNRRRWVVPWRRIPYQWIRTMRMSEIGTWRVANFGAPE